MSITVLEYHDATKHRFDRFARSSGRLDWATQPNPFRRFDGAEVMALPRARVATARAFDALYDDARPAVPVTAATVGELLRCSLGLSAWKSYGRSRWALRVNPSSGNLHPTEGYVVWEGGVFHYAPEVHALERRASLPIRPEPGPDEGLLVGLSSIHWREAWKYGERAYRYCQHDIGHALAAVRYAAALLGWQCTALGEWSDAEIAALLGLDRDDDFAGVERETAACLVLVGPLVSSRRPPVAPLVDAARRGAWRGRANGLSSGHVEWPIIDEVASAAAYPGVGDSTSPPAVPPGEARHLPAFSGVGDSPESDRGSPPGALDARALLLRRRSALAFEPSRHLSLDVLLRMLRRARPGSGRVPWDGIAWDPMVQLVLFVHRVDGLAPGVYVSLRDESSAPELRAAMRPEFLWEPVDDLFLLLPTDVTWVANRLSCDQDIASDGAFSLAMLSRFEPAIRASGDWLYRRLFWECGAIGQVLYLEAEAAGMRGTGIGCFYDDPVHDALGLTGRAWQSLYHFAVGAPVEDTRLLTEPGYAWEGGGSAAAGNPADHRG